MGLRTLRSSLGGESAGAIALRAACLVLALGFTADALAQKVAPRGRWGAIAYNSKTGAFGYAVDRPTKRVAESEAFKQCGSDCDIVKTFRNSCGAIATDAPRFSWDMGATREIAEQKALRKCGGACTIAVWACTS